MEARLTRQEYKEMRSKIPELNFKLCWQYYCDVKPPYYPSMDLPEFNIRFRDFLLKGNEAVFFTGTAQKVVLVNVIQEKIFDYFDNYFENEPTTQETYIKI